MMKYLFMIVLVMTTFLFTLFVFSPTFYQKNIVEIPDIINHNIDYAIEEIKSNNLNLEIIYLDSSIEKDLVVETKPQKGQLVKEGSKVVLTISNGLLSKRMIDVSNQYFDDVKEQLESLQVEITKVEIEDEQLPNEYIKKQFPKVNEIIAPGEEVILFITKKVSYFVVPNMMYWSQKEVENYCLERKINVLFEYSYNATTEKGKVFKQSIPKDTEIIINSQNCLIITLSLGEDPSYVPDIIDMPEIEGMVLLDKLGIIYEVNYVFSNEESGKIIDVWKKVNGDALDKVILIISGGKDEQGVSD